MGQVIDSATGAPLSAVFVSAAMLGDLTDSAGRFLVPYLDKGVHALVAERPGYLPAQVDLMIAPPDSTRVVIRLARAALPRYDLEGRSGLELILDSAGAGQTPTARRLDGQLTLSRQLPSLWGSTGQTDPWVRTIDGQYELDLTPFWGTQVAPDASTTVFGSADAMIAREASAATFNGDSITIDFIPRMSHGGISLSGRLTAPDTAVGEWFQRAYCCGASGHFRLWRISRDPGPITLPPRPAPVLPDTLAESDRAGIRVRVWDEAFGTYIKGWHDLELPGGSVKSVYTTGTQPGGWGKSFWLAPGRYRVIVDRYPCGNELYWLKHPIERAFVAKAGERQDITIRVNTRSLEPSRSYNNTAGRKCQIVLPDSLRSGA
jgi:hypothetical protein